MTLLPQLVIVANAGPAQLQYDAGGQVVPVWKPGGAAAVLIHVVEHQASLAQKWSEVRWYWSATTEAERSVESEDFAVRGITAHLVGVTPQVYKAFYGTFANSVLWALHHGQAPEVGKQDMKSSWQAYQQVNEVYAEHLTKIPDGATVLVNDYHFCLLGKLLADRRPDLDIVGFWHIAHAERKEMESYLPREICTEIFESMSAIPWGFHSPQWEHNYVDAVQEIVGTAPKTFVAPAQIDPDEIATGAATPAVEQKMWELALIIGNRRVVANVGRADPKNGQNRIFAAFEHVLDEFAAAPEPAFPFMERPKAPVLVMVMSRTRPGESMYDRSWEDATTETERINARYTGSIILLRNEGYDTTLAVQRSANVFVVAAPRGGRDIIGPEAVASKQPGDALLMEVITSGAACSETLGEVPVEVVRDFVIKHPTELSVPDEASVLGAYVVDCTGPAVSDEDAGLRLAKAILQALDAPAEERALRWLALQASVSQEDQQGWLDKVLRHADRNANWPVLSNELRHATPFPYRSSTQPVDVGSESQPEQCEDV